MTPQQLEAKILVICDKFRNRQIVLEEMTDDEIFAWLAYGFWKDGMDWNKGVPEIAEGKDPILKTRELCIQALKNIFGY
jgi:hypothetical protein